MAVVKAEVRRGTYMDSVVLMQLQKELRDLPGVLDAAVVMGTPANRQLLDQSDLWAAALEGSGPDDLLVSVRGEDETSAQRALGSWDQLRRQRTPASSHQIRPRSLETALRAQPGIGFASISVPGRYAADLAREALGHDLHVFLYSDNVPLEEEIRLKQMALEKGLLMMGPDCGTSIISGVGFGFANRVSPGPVGLVGASGTGLQAVSCWLHAAGTGISHVIGTGGRDLQERVGAITTLQAMSLLDADESTAVLVLVSKPPSGSQALRVLQEAMRLSKPVVVAFQGYAPPARQLENLYFACTLEEAGELALKLSNPKGQQRGIGTEADLPPKPGCLRGLFSGGTLAQEVLRILRLFAGPVLSNLETPLDSRRESRLEGHWVLDLGADEFTVGRLHPMLDYELRVRRLLREAEDPKVGVILLDVVLGDGAHRDPAAELGPALGEARRIAGSAGRNLDLIVLLVGSDLDPQELEQQRTRLEQAGARVEFSPQAAAVRAGRSISRPESPALQPAVDSRAFQGELVVVNLGLESFAESLQQQGARAIHVEWTPPAGGNSRLADILRRMHDR